MFWEGLTPYQPQVLHFVMCKVSWAFLVAGMKPLLSTDHMHFVISQASAEALAKVPDLETWMVAPTMVRGSGMKPAPAADPKKKTAKKVASTISKLAGKKSSKKPAVVNLDECELKFKRTKLGRSRIASDLENLSKMDWQSFPGNPIFNSDGENRMKLANANQANLPNVLKFGPWCVQNMFFG